MALTTTQIYQYLWEARKLTMQKIAWATMSFWQYSRGVREDLAEEEVLLGEGPFVKEPLAEDPVAEGPFVELEATGLVRSSWKVPESRCCWRSALGSEELGACVPKAHITFWSVSELGFGSN
jgi:hypothetical protein